MDKIGFDNLGQFQDRGPWYLGQTIIANGSRMIVSSEPRSVENGSTSMLDRYQECMDEETGRFYLVQCD